MNNLAKILYDWLDKRLPLSFIQDKSLKKTVPVYRYTFFYYLGGLTLFFFLIQVVTGILLMLYYKPSADEAFESIEFIMTNVSFGWLIRSLHAWSANLMIYFAFLHMVSTYFLKAYRFPNELTWISGALIFFFLLAFGFSGYLLPWDKLAFFATKIGTDIAKSIPFVGHWIMRFLRGGDNVTGGTLSRFFGWHVAVLPPIIGLLIGIHLFFIQLNGLSVTPGYERKNVKTMKFFPGFILRESLSWALAFSALTLLVALFPSEIGQKADLFASAYKKIRPEWYFIFMFQTLKLLPGGEILGIGYEAIPNIVFGIIATIVVFIPLIDKGVIRNGKSPGFTALGIIFLCYIVFMTSIGYNSIKPLLVIFVTLIILLAFSINYWKKE